MRLCLLLQVLHALCYEHTGQLRKESNADSNSLVGSLACIINSAETPQAHQHYLIICLIFHLVSKCFHLFSRKYKPFLG